jgi:hypothetical protein
MAHKRKKNEVKCHAKNGPREYNNYQAKNYFFAWIWHEEAV